MSGSIFTHPDDDILILPIRPGLQLGPVELGVKTVRRSSSGAVTLIHRVENAGMDIGSHNVSISYFLHIKKLWCVLSSTHATQLFDIRYLLMFNTAVLIMIKEVLTCASC